MTQLKNPGRPRLCDSSVLSEPCGTGPNYGMQRSGRDTLHSCSLSLISSTMQCIAERKSKSRWTRAHWTVWPFALAILNSSCRMASEFRMHNSSASYPSFCSLTCTKEFVSLNSHVSLQVSLNIELRTSLGQNPTALALRLAAIALRVSARDEGQVERINPFSSFLDVLSFEFEQRAFPGEYAAYRTLREPLTSAFWN